MGAYQGVGALPGILYGKVTWEHVVCQLYGGCPYLRGSVMGGFMVLNLYACVHNITSL